MLLCFDATRFGTGLTGAIELAARKNVPLVEFSFAPFPTPEKGGASLSRKEKEHLKEVAELSREKSVAFACLNLDYCLVAEDKKQMKQFLKMIGKLAQVAGAIGCERVSFSLMPGADGQWKQTFEDEFPKVAEALAEHNVGPLLRLATPLQFRGQSLKAWRSMEPMDWRDLLSGCANLSLTFSPADCVWLGIDYLRILSGVASAIEHVEAHDVEINRELLTDSGMFGPLWWRYRLPGKGQVDWAQLIEALKLYDFKGSFSLHLDDEFVPAETEELENALDSSLKKIAPLLRG